MAVVASGMGRRSRGSGRCCALLCSVGRDFDWRELVERVPHAGMLLLLLLLVVLLCLRMGVEEQAAAAVGLGQNGF